MFIGEVNSCTLHHIQPFYIHQFYTDYESFYLRRPYAELCGDLGGSEAIGRAVVNGEREQSHWPSQGWMCEATGRAGMGENPVVQ